MPTLLSVKAVPGASRTEFKGWLGNALKIRVQAPPEDGKANRLLCTFIANELGLPAGSVTLVSGASSPLKTFRIEGMNTEQLQVAIARLAIVKSD